MRKHFRSIFVYQVSFLQLVCYNKNILIEYARKDKRMKKYKKECMVSLFVIGCIFINLGGRLLVEHFQLPLWMDSFGTVVAAYVLGPVCGAVVGASLNISYGLLFSYTQMIYGLINIAIAIIIGICAKKGYLDYLFGVLSVSFFVTLMSASAGTILSYVFFDGALDNIWADGVCTFLEHIGCNTIFSHVTAEFYLEFVDKVVTLMLLFVIVKISHRWRAGQHRKTQTLSVFMLFMIPALALLSPQQTSAADLQEQQDYNSYLQTVYDSENGLPGGKANDIAQGKDGVLWIGTYSGLYRYTGTSFKLMDTFDSVKNANCLYTDESERLWIGTNDSGLSICMNECISNTIDETDGLPSDSVRCITQGADGYYYVGTTDSLAVVSISGGLRVAATIPQITYARSITADDHGNVVVVTDEGGLYLLSDGEICQTLLPENGYKSCAFDQSGTLYAGTANGQVDVYEIKEHVLTQIGQISGNGLRSVNSIQVLENGEIFLCADNGVWYLDAQQECRHINVGAFNSSIDHMLVDYQGNLWFTSSRLGLMRLCRSVFSDTYSGPGREENVVNSVVQWNGSMYVGTDVGLDVFGEHGIKRQDADPLTDMLQGVRIRCLMVDRRSRLWVCTSGKGVFCQTTDGDITVYDSSQGALGEKFRCVIELSDGTIAAAGDSGVTFIRQDAVVATIGVKDGLKNPKILCLLEQSDGSILAGTDGDGIAVIRDGVYERMIKKSDGLGSEVILRMVHEKNGAGIFIVTSNSICYRNGKGGIRVLSNFHYYNNYDLVERDDGTLFILSSAGIYVMEKSDLLSSRAIEYELLNEKKGLLYGLTPNSWNYLDADDNLYLSTDSGVVSLNLNSYDTAARSYRMLMKSVRVDGVTYSIENGEPIQLARGAARVDFMPEIVNFSVNNPYVSVWLEGFDENPTVMLQSDLAEVSYTNLPAGSYTFHLAILGNKAKNTTAENTYKVIKEKEIYDQWWFIAYMIGVFALTIIYLSWLIFRTQIQKTLTMQKRELELARKQVEMGNETILTIAKTVDAKDENTSQHSIRVSEYAVLIAKELGFSEQACDELRRTALLHDIGKIAIPDSVLNKPSRLTDEEYEIMKSHVVKGGEILKNFTLLKHVEEGALYHHERYDGRGYVHGLKGEEIPLNARIIGIADAFDAMTANRVYRKKLDMDYVLSELQRGRGTQFDPELVDLMLKLIDNGTIDVAKLYEETAKAKSAGDNQNDTGNHHNNTDHSNTDHADKETEVHAQ